MQAFELSAAQAASTIRDGTMSSEELVTSCLERIGQLEDDLGAWQFLDPELALQQARNADLARRAGEPLGKLHGVPIGVKDIFDTQDMPTEDGTTLHAGRTPAYDAAAVAAMRAAGAVIMGKTVTTELAVVAPGKTRNPHDKDRTPGGSSSGSAAAVAAQMVPLAVGTQTNGSVIRPASYCGVVGFKPSHGLISRYRVLQQSRVLDHVGVFARNIEDAALLAEQLIAHDERDPDTRVRARPQLQRIATEEPPTKPVFAFVKTPEWRQADSDNQEAFAELVEFLGGSVREVNLDELLEPVVAAHRTIMEADIALSYQREYERGAAQLSDALKSIIERGQQIRAIDYNQALACVAPISQGLNELLLEYDAILTPATTGEAPQGLASTGNPVFCTPWSLCGMPALSLPALQGSAGLPLGLQLVAAKGDDARLLRTASWLANRLAQA